MKARYILLAIVPSFSIGGLAGGAAYREHALSKAREVIFWQERRDKNFLDFLYHRAGEPQLPSNLETMTHPEVCGLLEEGE